MSANASDEKSLNFLEEIVEPARSELVAGEFQPFLGHGEESGAGVRVGGMSRQIKTLGRRPSELAGVIFLQRRTPRGQSVESPPVSSRQLTGSPL